MRVAELGSITKTAEELFVAQSAISTSIANLENNVGCRLFVRQRSRGVVLTEQGRSFYTTAQEILRAVDEALDSLTPERVSGPLVAGCFTTLAPYWLPEVYEHLTGTFPDMTVRIREVRGEEVEQLLLQRDLEAVLTYGFDYGPSIGFEHLTEAPLYAAVAEHSHLAGRESVSLEELATEPLVLLNMAKSTSYFLSLFHTAHLRPTVHERFESLEVVRAMVGRGHGYTILNQRPVHDLTNDGNRIVRLPITGVRSHLQVGVAYRAGEQLSRKGSEFVEACRTVLSRGEAADQG
ncbi:LysR family transcriptional regulator [Promicromonospora xylanilytica]